MSAPVDVLNTLRKFERTYMVTGLTAEAGDIAAVFVAIAELIEAAKLVNADHSAPHDCYATGPLTGDPHLDLVRCPGCQLAAAIARVGGDA